MSFTDTSWWSWKYATWIAPKIILGHILAFTIAYAWSTYETYTPSTQVHAVELKSYPAEPWDELG